MRTPAAVRVALVAITCLMSACAGSGPDEEGGGGGPPTTTACKAPAPGACTVCYAANIQPIYDVSCAVAGCHLGATAQLGLDLSAGKSYADTVNVESTQKPLKLVKPGKPSESYLYLKITEQPPASVGSQMPQECPARVPCLEQSQKDAIQTWIQECAGNN